MSGYEHRQSAFWLWVLLVPATGVAVFADLAPPGLLALIFVVVSGVRWYFGWGFPAASFRWSEFVAAAPIRTSFLQGWGLHWNFWQGWMWNVTGSTAVQFDLAGRRRVTIGTDDAQGLYEAVERFRKDAA